MFYFGRVENIHDPLNIGRVQVRVIPFYNDLNSNDLPWAYVLRSTDLGLTLGRGLNQHNLINGSQVMVDFLDPNMQQPVVLGVIPREADFVERIDPLIHTLKFLNGTEIRIDETPDESFIKVTDVNQNFILMSNTGVTVHVGNADYKIILESAGDINLESNGSTNITTKKDTVIKSTGDVNIESTGSTNIKASGETTIEGSKLSLKNILGTSQLCCLPKCLFTGGQHQSPNSD